jgi:membrane protein
MDRLKALWARFQLTSVGRAWKRYGDARGNLLAGGVAYFAFFSLFPVIALAFTIFGLVLRDQPQILDQIRNFLNDTLPGFVKSSPDSSQGIIPIEVPSGTTLTTTGVIGVAFLLWSGLGWLGALRDGIREIFGVPGSPGNFLTDKVRDVGVLCTLGIGLALSAGVTIVASSAARWLAGLVGLGNQGWLLTGVGLAVGALLDTGLVLLMLRFLSGVDVPWRGLRSGAIFGGVGLTLLKLFGTALIKGTMSNPLFASIALVVGLLVWLQFMSRVVLISAAWAANDLDAVAAHISSGQRHKLLEGPDSEREAARARRRATRAATAGSPESAVGAGEPFGAASAPADPTWVSTVQARVDAGLPTFGQRSADRTTLAAGAVLGAVSAMGMGWALRGTRALLRLGRG